MKAADNSWCHI